MSSRASLLVLSLLAGAAALPQGPARAAETVGSTVGVAALVTAQLSQDTRTLAVGDAVRQNELIAVSEDGSGRFRLLDDTRLALGPGAELVLDTFVYDPARSGNTIAMRFAKGAFRFITGLAEKPAYAVHLPTASIAVRGTTFDVFVEESGTSWLLLHEGAVRICNKAGVCRDHDEIGKLVRIGGDGTLSAPTRWTSLPRAERISFDEAFPFVGSPPSFDAAPAPVREASLKPTSDTAKAPQPKPNAVPKAKAKAKAKAKTREQAAAAPAETPAVKRVQKKAKAKAKLKAPAVTKAGAAKAGDTRRQDRATQERERGLDVAAKYAPKTIERLRKKRTIERAETSKSGKAGGWRSYVDTYVKGR